MVQERFGVVLSAGRNESLGKITHIGHMGPTAHAIHAVSALAALGGALKTEYLLILLLRHVIDTGLSSVGLLAGLNDPRLHPANLAMNERPEHSWSLDELATLASLSRARSAQRFCETVGTTPLQYLTKWHIGVACSLLRKGIRIERVATSVGFQSQSAFTRVLSKQMAISPGEWLAQAYENRTI
jgi:AraC-like DNA-binding protein